MKRTSRMEKSAVILDPVDLEEDWLGEEEDGERQYDSDGSEGEN